MAEVEANAASNKDPVGGAAARTADCVDDLQSRSQSAGESLSLLKFSKLPARKVRCLPQKRWSRRVVTDTYLIACHTAGLLGNWVCASILAANSYENTEMSGLLFSTVLLAAVLLGLSLGYCRPRLLALGSARPFAVSALQCGTILVAILLQQGGIQALLSEHCGLVLLFACSGGLVSLLTSSALERIAACADLGARLTTKIAIFGATPRTFAIYEQIIGGENREFAGVFDDRKDFSRITNTGLALEGTSKELLEKIQAGYVDEVVIALPSTAVGRISEISTLLRQHPVDVWICTHLVPEIANVPVSNSMPSSQGTARGIWLQRRTISHWGQILKLLLDRVAGAILLIALLPIFLLIAVAIKTTSAGPIFFHQRRHGLSGQSIVVWKFRTMHVMEDGATVRQVTKADSRVTTVGRALRASSLDELPQLINVVQGNMSLVGPRPHAIAHNEHYGPIIANYIGRNQVKPGMTGWAQINGYRGETRNTKEMADRIEKDLWYVANWSFWLDVKILLATPFLGFVNKKAY